MTILLYPVLAAALYYIGFWAKVTEPIWRRYPNKFNAFMGCAACSGFWYGLTLELVVGRFTGWTYGGLSYSHPVSLLASGLVATMTTPTLAEIHIKSLQYLGIASGLAPDPLDLPAPGAPPASGVPQD